MTPEPIIETESPEAAPAAPASETALQTHMSAMGTVHAGTLEATGSAIGFANISGDTTLTASAAPIVFSKGNVSLRQCYTSAVIAGTQMDVSQAGAPLIIGKKLSVQQGGAMVMLSGKSKVRSGFVGVLLSPKAEISEDSRVLISTKAAVIIALALLGGFGLVAVVMALGVRRVVSWRPGRNMSVPHLPHLAEIQERLHKMRGCRCGHRR